MSVRESRLSNDQFSKLFSKYPNNERDNLIFITTENPIACEYETSFSSTLLEDAGEY